MKNSQKKAEILLPKNQQKKRKLSPLAQLGTTTLTTVKKYTQLIFWSLLISLQTAPVKANQASQFDTMNLLDNMEQFADFIPNTNSEDRFQIKKNSTFLNEFLGHELSHAEIYQIIEAASPYFNLHRVPSGITYSLGYSPSPRLAPTRIEFDLSPTEKLIIKRAKGFLDWQANLIKKEVEVRTVYFAGKVQNSLWESAKAAAMDAKLISDLTNVFAWQIDFARQVRAQDHWRLIVEEHLVDGKRIGWGRILIAEYHNDGEAHQAIYYEKENAISGYFAPNGKSLEKMFLKSPIEFARITSGFNLRRFHPILKTRRPHLGVDYAAPIGTPVRAVGDGHVTQAKYTPAGGFTLEIRHNSIYKTRHLHLKGFAKNIKRGAKVRQGQVIAYVGNTGLSTGPHLHFEFYKNGVFVDPLKVKAPAALSIPPHLMAEFSQHVDLKFALLEFPGRQIAKSLPDDGPSVLLDNRFD